MSKPASRMLMRWRRRRISILVITATSVLIASCVWAVMHQHGTSAPLGNQDASINISAPEQPSPPPAHSPTATATATPTAAPAAVGGAITDDTTLVTIGDSIMAGYGLSDSATSAWPIRLGAQTNTPVVNDSCSGAGFIADGDCGTNYAGLIPAAVAAHPGMIIIQSSDNDLGQDPAQLAAATTQTLQALHQAVPSARIVGLSTLWDQPGPIPSGIAQSSTDLEQALSTVGGTFITLGQPLAGHSEMLQADSEHPTDIGQEALSTSILTSLRTAGV